MVRLIVQSLIILLVTNCSTPQLKDFILHQQAIKKLYRNLQSCNKFQPHIKLSFNVTYLAYYASKVTNKIRLEQSRQCKSKG